MRMLKEFFRRLAESVWAFIVGGAMTFLALVFRDPFWQVFLIGCGVGGASILASSIVLTMAPTAPTRSREAHLLRYFLGNSRHGHVDIWEVQGFPSVCFLVG